MATVFLNSARQPTNCITCDRIPPGHVVARASNLPSARAPLPPCLTTVVVPNCTPNNLVSKYLYIYINIALERIHMVNHYCVQKLVIKLWVVTPEIDARHTCGYKTLHTNASRHRVKVPLRTDSAGSSLV